MTEQVNETGCAQAVYTQGGAVRLKWVLTRTRHDLGDAKGVWPTLVDRRLGRGTLSQETVGVSWLELGGFVYVVCVGISPSRPVVKPDDITVDIVVIHVQYEMNMRRRG